MENNITNAAIFLLETVFITYISILLIRILSPGLHGAYHNPIAQFILKTTSPLILPIRRLIPYHKPVDIGAVLLVLVLETIYIILYAWLQTGIWIDVTSLLIWLSGDLLHLLVSILFWSVAANAILSWIETPHGKFYDVRLVLEHLTAPIMSPLRRVIPTVNGLDFSPVIALIIIKFIDILLIYPILLLGIRQATGDGGDV